MHDWAMVRRRLVGAVGPVLARLFLHCWLVKFHAVRGRVPFGDLSLAARRRIVRVVRRVPVGLILPEHGHGAPDSLFGRLLLHGRRVRSGRMPHRHIFKSDWPRHVGRLHGVLSWLLL
jgi:hypothetical protein